MSNKASGFHIGTSSFEPDNRVLSSYLADGTLTKRYFSSVRTRTTVRVNSKGDTIVRTIREPVIDHTRYRGDWEINGSGWRLNTPEGIATVVKNGTAAQGVADAGRTFTHLWYVRDRLGSVRTVVDDEGTIRQCTMYYPSGLPVQLFGTKRVTDRAHIGNRWSNFAGLGWHDNTARWHDAILDRFTTPDPKSADYPSFSPYTHCAANPLRFTDPTGMVLVLTGDGEAVDNTIQLYNKMVVDGAKVYINDDGNIQISRTEKTSTEAENCVIDLLSSVINDKQTTTINIVDNSAEILIGDASKKTIDIGDIQALGDNGPTSSSAALLHETDEQFLVQAKGVELFKAHNSSIRMEAKYTGYAPFSTAHTDYSATFSGSSNNVPGQPKVLSQRHVRIGQPFGDKGSVTITLVLFLNGNINSKLYFR